MKVKGPVQYIGNQWTLALLGSRVKGSFPTFLYGKNTLEGSNLIGNLPCRIWKGIQKSKGDGDGRLLLRGVSLGGRESILGCLKRGGVEGEFMVMAKGVAAPTQSFST